MATLATIGTGGLNLDQIESWIDHTGLGLNRVLVTTARGKLIELFNADADAFRKLLSVDAPIEEGAAHANAVAR